MKLSKEVLHYVSSQIEDEFNYDYCAMANIKKNKDVYILDFSFFLPQDISETSITQRIVNHFETNYDIKRDDIIISYTKSSKVFNILYKITEERICQLYALFRIKNIGKLDFVN